MRDLECKVLKNQRVGAYTYLMEVEFPYTESILPGHFFMVRSWDGLDPLSRRAFAVADKGKDSLVFYYDVVGRATTLMAKLREGERVSILGPLGKNLFPLEGEKHLLLGGGIGLSGLSLLAKELRRLGKEVFVCYGARSSQGLAMKEWLKNSGLNHRIFTDDGSEGEKGSVLDCLKDFGKEWIVHACGPKAMLRALQGMAEDKKVYLSLEAPMACGWGVCLGCVVRSKDGKFLRVCYEGPVFDFQEVVF
ncbi:dihydroorotate dehydrogenase electron transfer subunit [Thermocrinis sp.]